MHSLPSFPQTAKSLRTATLLLAAALWVGASFQKASAADALTTSSVTNVSKWKSLFSKSSTCSSTDTGTSSAKTTKLSNGILGLPISIVKSVFTGASKIASNAVTKHITKN